VLWNVLLLHLVLGVLASEDLREAWRPSPMV